MTEAMCMAIQAIRQFVYYTYNHNAPRDICDGVWGKGCDADHFYNKLMGYINRETRSDSDINRFYIELSSNNQDKFAEWIICNYKGVDRNAPRLTKEESWQVNTGRQNYILERFFNECLAYWIRDGKAEKAWELAIADIPKTNPYSPQGLPFNEDIREKFIQEKQNLKP